MNGRSKQLFTMEQTSQEWRQYLITCIGAFSMTLAGYALGWTSPINIKFSNPEESPFAEPLTLDQESWIGSLLTIGGMFGPFLGGMAVGKLGRQWAQTVSCIPLLLSWTLIAVSSSLTMLYAARVLVGIFVGMTYTICPVYLGEIATDERRGAVCATIGVFLSGGFFLIYSIGPYLSYEAVAYVAIAMSLFYLTVSLFTPETPYFYLSKGDLKSARHSLMKIRGKCRKGVQAELDKLTIVDINDSTKNSVKLADMFRGNVLTALYISCGLMMAQQLAGINAVLFYMTNIFEAAGTPLDAAISTIIIGAIQFLVSPVSPLISDRVGRRILLLVSCGGMAIGHACLGTYFHLEATGNPIVERIGLVPLAALVVFVALYMCGAGPLPMVYAAEVVPAELKATAMPLVMSFSWILSFLVTRYFGPLMQAVGMGPTFWIFGGVCVLSFLFVWFLVPETKGKSLHEIQDILKKNSLA